MIFSTNSFQQFHFDRCTLKMKQQLICLLVILTNACHSSGLNSKTSTTINDAHGLKMSANDNFTVYALETYKAYLLHRLWTTVEAECAIQYINPEFYVYGLLALTMRDNSNISFVQIAENTTSQEAVLSIITFNSDLCSGFFVPQGQDTIVWTQSHQEYMSIKIDPQEKFAYVFADSFILSYDLSTNLVDQFIDTTNGTFWNNHQVTVRSFDLTNEWALVAGYTSFQIVKTVSFYIAFRVKLRPLRCIPEPIQFHGGYVSTAEVLVYNREYDLSVSLNSFGLLAAIGVPILNRVVLIQFFEDLLDETSDNGSFTVNQDGLYVSSSSDISGYGRSVTWLNDPGTLAILVETSENQVWSTSEVRIYSNISSFNVSTGVILDFIFPNNQQTLGDYLNSFKPGFIQVLSRSKNLLVLTDAQWLLYIPTAGPGQAAVLLTDSQDFFTYVFQPNACVSGTYKSYASLGPCTVCPPQTKNPRNGTFPVTECFPCKQTSFCPLGSTDDVKLADFPPYIQTFAYPDSPDTDNFDDLLILHFFTIPSNTACMILSPLFWAIVIIVGCFIVWVIMRVLKMFKYRGPSSLGSHRKQVKIFLKHCDIIFEGERWIGGLASFAVMVVIGFTCWFSLAYLQLYPIETSSDFLASCRAPQYNSNFDNGLQLPLSDPNGTSWAIFDMLDSQPFTLFVDVINSPVQCTDIRIQQNRRSLLPVSLPTRNCTLSSSNLTGYFSFDPPAHTTTVQVDIIGPYFIGALRFCIRGPSDIKDKVNILHELDVCTLFYTANQTIGLSTDFTVKLIKVVNVTKPLTISDHVQYDGRWAVIMTTDTLSDELFFEQNGKYLRYASDRTTFTIAFSEESYFLQNNQKPIIRAAALSFHTLLFVGFIIQMFAAIFLLFKMCGKPLIKKMSRALVKATYQKGKYKLERSNGNNLVSLSIFYEISF